MNAVLRGPDYETPVTYWMPFNGCLLYTSSTLSKKDLDSIINDGEAIEVKCQFCNKAYHFDVDELKEMRSAK